MGIRHVLLLMLYLMEQCIGVRLDWLVLEAVLALFFTLMLWKILVYRSTLFGDLLLLFLLRSLLLSL
jgi:hypothetical protein